MVPAFRTHVAQQRRPTGHQTPPTPMHTHSHTCAHAFTHTHVPKHTHTCTHKHAHSHTDSCTHTHAHLPHIVDVTCPPYTGTESLGWHLDGDMTCRKLLRQVSSRVWKWAGGAVATTLAVQLWSLSNDREQFPQSKLTESNETN